MKAAVSFIIIRMKEKPSLKKKKQKLGKWKSFCQILVAGLINANITVLIYSTSEHKAVAILFLAMFCAL